MLAEGKNPVREALKSNLTIEKILVLDKTQDKEIREQIEIAKQRKIRVEFVQKVVLDKMSQTGHHQGIIAVTTDFKYSDLDQILSKVKNNNKRKLFLILDGIEDPHNLGGIIRSAECFGVSAVIIPARRSALVNETVIRTSAGAVNLVDVCKVTNVNDAIKKLKDNNIFVYAADMDGEPIARTNLTGDIAIVVGSEGFGVSNLTRKLADQIVAIPMIGEINSLNASVSAGIMLYEAFRQQKK